MQRTLKKCSKIYNSPAQLLFYSLNLLFGDVLVAAPVVVYLLSSLFWTPYVWNLKVSGSDYLLELFCGWPDFNSRLVTPLIKSLLNWFTSYRWRLLALNLQRPLFFFFLRCSNVRILITFLWLIVGTQAIHVEDGSFSWDKDASPVLQR